MVNEKRRKLHFSCCLRGRKLLIELSILILKVKNFLISAQSLKLRLYTNFFLHISSVKIGPSLSESLTQVAARITRDEDLTDVANKFRN